MASFSILLFFALTGITLNHQDKLNGEPKVTRWSGRVDESWVRPPAGQEVDRTRIAAALRSAHRIKGSLSDFRVDDDQISVTFKGPGYAADAFVDRKTGSYEITETRLGLVAIVNDLHKGRDTGAAWAQVIDISAALMIFLSLTGLTLMFFLHRRLKAGLVMLAIGTALCVAVFELLVS